ncbi:MAG: FAD-dependent oxidoreductase [Clostridiaceae bacterium]|nr:FAD-dependent oxidoreductase [Clostridiaceae bacterium]
MKVVIVGGVAGGATAAARLRRLDEKADIVMFEKGEYISYANCGLPYYIGGTISKKSALTLQTPDSFRSRFNVDVRIKTEIISINRAEKTVTARNLITGEEYKENYDKLILSMGAEPVKPPIKGLENNKVFTLRTVPDTFKIREYIDSHHPENAVVVGGGAIGVEMAENLKNAGLDVTIVELADHLIAPLDFDMAQDVHKYIKSQGVRLILSNGVKEIEESDGRLKVILNKGCLLTDMLILSVGVRPESRIAKEAGLELNQKGFIKVNENMQTSDSDIYAVGDAVEIDEFVTKSKASIPLAGPANKQGRIAADNICGIKSKYKGTQGSSIIKVFDMTVASTGINERTAKAMGINYDKVFTYSASHAGYYPGGSMMSIKTIFEKPSGKILGVQIVGYDGVDKRCDVFATAIRAGMTAFDLTELELCYAPPFSSAKDPVNFAGYVIENTLTGMVKNFHWHDVKDLPRDGSVQLLDVRTTREYSNGRIDGFINIPLDSLRDNLDKLDKSKPVYVHCHSGLRSYIACRLLSGLGFDAYNLSGGYRLYETVVNQSNIEDYSCYNCK